jgi:hypothetical protein
MVIPLRFEYLGAVYHVTARGDRREPIAKDDADRTQFLDIRCHALHRFDAQGGLAQRNPPTPLGWIVQQRRSEKRVLPICPVRVGGACQESR